MVLHSELTHHCDELIEELQSWVYTTEKVLRMKEQGVPFTPADKESAAVATASKLAAIRCVHKPLMQPRRTYSRHRMSHVGAPSKPRSSSRLWASIWRMWRHT